MTAHLQGSGRLREKVKEILELGRRVAGNVQALWIFCLPPAMKTSRAHMERGELAVTRHVFLLMSYKNWGVH